LTLESTGKWPLDEKGKFPVNENDEENDARDIRAPFRGANEMSEPAIARSGFGAAHRPGC
jgi:hypothetical protein